MKTLENQLAEYGGLQEEVFGPIALDEITSRPLTPAAGRHPLLLRHPVALATVAMVVVILVIGGIAVLTGGGSNEADPVDQPVTPSSSTTLTPSITSPAPTPASAAPTVLVPWGGPVSRAHLTVMLPDGWESYDGFIRTPDLDDRFGFMRVGSSEVANIYSEPCLNRLLDPPLGPTVDDLAAAFADAWGTNATTPTEMTLDGFVGKQMVLTVPADVDFADCVTGRYMAWRDTGGGDRWYQGPGQIQESWIVDVEGERLLIEASYFPEIYPENRSELQQVIDSIQIESE